MRFIFIFLFLSCGSETDTQYQCVVNGHNCNKPSEPTVIQVVGPKGAAGADGSSCSAVTTEAGVELQCDDGTSALIPYAQDGATGSPGVAGAGTQGPPGPPGEVGGTGERGEPGAPADPTPQLELVFPCDGDTALLQFENGTVLGVEHRSLVIFEPGGHKLGSCKFTVDVDGTVTW